MCARTKRSRTIRRLINLRLLQRMLRQAGKSESGHVCSTCLPRNSTTSVLGLSLNLSERKGISDHFNVNVSSGWYAHGDRIKAATSARSRQDRHLKNHLGFSINHPEFWRLANRKPVCVLLARFPKVPNRLGRELNLVSNTGKFEL